jgi:hypothetical protein
MNDLMILKFRMYHYKEFVKIFANNFYSEGFEGTRHSFYAMLFLPTVTMTFFNLFNPFSVFRRIIVTSTLLGATFSVMLNLKEELGDLAQKDPGPLGEAARYRFQQLALFDGLVRSYTEEGKRLKEKAAKSANS